MRLLGDATPSSLPSAGSDGVDSREQQTTPGHLAAAALVAVGSRTVPALIGALQQPEWVARRNAAWALGALDDPRGVAPVTAALQDREPPVRAQAAWALGAMDADSAVQALVAALKDTDDGVRKQAAWALGAIGSRAAVGGLSQALKDSHAQVRHQAAWALGAIGDRNAVPGLVDTLEGCRQGRAPAGGLGARRARRCSRDAGLVAALKDSEAGVRRQAAWALGAIGK